MASSVFAQEPAPWRAAIPEDFPPQYQVNSDGQPEGFAIDVMNEIARRTGRRVEYVVKPGWLETFQALREGEVDLIPNLAITDSRRHEFAFSRPLETFGVAVFVRASDTNMRTLDDLSGKVIGAISTNIAGSILGNVQVQHLRTFEHPAQALINLVSGQIDAVVYPAPSLIAQANRADISHRIRKLDGDLIETKRGIAVQAHRAELLAALDPAIEALQKTPEYTRLYTKWYGYKAGYWTTERAAILAGVALIVGGLLFFIIRFILLQNLNRQLRQQISERQRVEHELVQSESRYRQLIEASPLGVWVVDADDKTTLINDALTSITGYTRADVLGRSFFDVIPRAVHEAAKYQLANQRSHAGESMETEISRKDGSRIAVSVTATPIVKDGTFCGAIAMMSDISARRRAESERQRLQEALQQNQKMEAMGRLAGGIAHDFNNVLQGIFTSVELAQRQTNPSDLRRLLTQARDFGDRGRDLVRQIMTFSRRESAELTPIDLACVINDALKLARAILPSSIAIETNVAADAWILGNESQLQQVLINLCTNAAHAMEDQQGTIAIRLAKSDRGQQWVLTIQDNGHGMSADVLPHIFEPFFTTKAMGEGTGMGLTVVHGIVTAHHGQISVTSVPESTVFTIAFPVAIATNQPTRSQAAQPRAPSFGRGRIMIVDDERMIVELCRETLIAQGYDVEAFQDGQSAMNRLIRRDAPVIDLIVTDNSMPGMSGLQLAEAVGRLEDAPPVVLISGFLDERELRRSRGIVVNCLYKPVKIDELKAVVAQTLTTGT